MQYRLTLLLIVISLLTSSLPQSAFAAPSARVPRDPVLLVTSPSRNLVIQKSSQDATLVEGFSRNEIRKFLMLAHGPESTNLRYQVGSSFLGQMGDNRLRFTNAPFSDPLTYEQQNAYYGKQSQTLWKCVRYRVVDAGMRGLRFPARQVGCTIERVDTNTAVASGGLCYFGIDFESSFTVAYEMNPQCIHREYLEREQISPTDFFVFAGYYIAGDATGSSMDLTPLDAGRVHLSIEPWKENIALSAEMGDSEPLWPAEVGFDAHLGEIKLMTNSQGMPSIETPLLIRNRCEAICRDSTCPSRCNFSAAVGAFMQVEELGHTTPMLLDAWYAGGVAPPNWEGFMPTQRAFTYPLFRVGGRYRVSADLSYPDTYYRIFRENFSQILIDLASYNDSLDSVGLGTLPTLTPIKPLSNAGTVLPVIPALSGLGQGGGGMNSLWGPLEALNNMISYSNWPPYYEKYCAGSKCVPVLDGTAKLKLTVEFTIVGFSSDNSAILTDFVVTRDSNIFGSYARRVGALPSAAYVLE